MEETEKKTNGFVVYQTEQIIQLVRVVDGKDNPQRCPYTSPTVVPQKTSLGKVTMEPSIACCDNTCPLFELDEKTNKVRLWCAGRFIDLLETDDKTIPLNAVKGTGIIIP